MTSFINNSLKFAKEKMLRYMEHIKDKNLPMGIIDNETLSTMIDEIAHVCCVSVYDDLARSADKLAKKENAKKFEDNINNWDEELFQEDEDFIKKRNFLQSKPYYLNTQLELLSLCLTASNNEVLLLLLLLSFPYFYVYKIIIT